MFRDNRRYISENDTRDDYILLDLKLNSPSLTWDAAIDIFRGRIEGRFLDPMNTLIQADVNKNGFAAMALCCLLIEALMQFREGYPQSKEYRNKECYKKFLSNQLSEVFNGQTAVRFYKDIRCGILHSAQTKSGSCLTYNTDYTVRIQGNNVMMVDVQNMCNKVEQYFERYCEELKNTNDINLRTNFICKMDDITKRYTDTGIIDNVWFAIAEKEGREIVFHNSHLYIQSVTDNTIKMAKERRGGVIRITKEEVEDALYYWPNDKAIKLINNGELIYMILNLCKVVADELIIRKTA